MISLNIFKERAHFTSLINSHVCSSLFSYLSSNFWPATTKTYKEDRKMFIREPTTPLVSVVTANLVQGLIYT
ncbi:hypothetical protein C2S52_009232 [Perilla frutescens var. hirtella]|nr:hypothetical protein C2S51_017262 [Perilla frutescens var. frutescens]KAH6784273.1 hypothetical protein C2S52_009232 [Perilla frutescens var. hirtella]